MNRAERKRNQKGHEIVGWREHAAPKNLGIGDGWFNEFDKVYSNGLYAVLVRTVETEWGPVIHAAMRNALGPGGTGTDIPWAEMQKIKNELFGRERVGVEVFPKESELIDAANMYHIWILPENMNLPFGID